MAMNMAPRTIKLIMCPTSPPTSGTSWKWWPAEPIPIDWAMPWGGAHSVLVNSPTTIAHMAKTSPAIKPGRAHLSTVLVPDSCDISNVLLAPLRDLVMHPASQPLSPSSVTRITVPFGPSAPRCGNDDNDKYADRYGRQARLHAPPEPVRVDERSRGRADLKRAEDAALRCA